MFLSKYGVARIIYIPVIKRAAVDFALGSDWTPVAGDVLISKDGGVAANVTNLPTAIAMGNGAIWLFSLTAAEMQAAQVMVIVADAATKAVEDQSFVIETYGNASGQHEFDLDTASQIVASVTGAVGSVTGAVGSVTGNVGGNVTGSVGSVAAGGITAASIAADAITAAKIADGAIDALTFAAGAINAAAIAADAITDAKVAADVTIASVTGAVGSVTGAVGSVTGAVGSVTGNVGGNVVGTVASVVGNVAGNVVGTVGSVVGSVGSVTAGVTLAASAVQAIWDALTTALTTVGSIGKRLADNIDAAVSTRLATASYTAPLDAAGTRSAVGLATANLDTQLTTIDDFLDTEIAAIKAKTDSLTFTVAGQVDANLQYVNDVQVNGVGSAGNPWGP